tara:strand:- start:727 stop:921 length:195 start_codon:yes stop_codon:yes gene_type:complete
VSPFSQYPEFMNGRLKKVDMESRLLKIKKGIDDHVWYPNWNDSERWAAQSALNNALEILDEFDY